MREIHHERVKRRKEQEHNRTHQNHHSQWFNDVMSRLRTSKPTIIPYGGLRALSSAEQLEVAPWPEPEPTPHAGAVSGEVSPKDRKGLMMEGSLEESVWVAGKRERAAPVGRIYGPHLRRPARGEGCPSRSKRYNETIGGNAGGYPGSEGVVRGQLRRRGSLVFGDLGWRVKNRMQRVSRFLREL